MKAEPFLQWVVEDRFVRARAPTWSSGGVQTDSDVAPWEEAKLRMLNGAHSAMAYLGGLSGHRVRRTGGRSGPIRGLIVDGDGRGDCADADAAAGADGRLCSQADGALLQPGAEASDLPDRDGRGQKLPQRLLATIAERLRGGAGRWMRSRWRWRHGCGGRRARRCGRPLRRRRSLAAIDAASARGVERLAGAIGADDHPTPRRAASDRGASSTGYLRDQGAPGRGRSAWNSNDDAPLALPFAGHA